MSQNNKSSSVTDRIGTIGANNNDERVIEKVKRYAFKSYEDEVVVKMPYADQSGSTTTLVTNISSFWQYKVNSIFDPDLTGVGHQPLGRDTWASIYNYYKVLECNIMVEIVDTNLSATGGSAAAQAPTYYGLMLDITATPPGTRLAWLEAVENNNNRQQMFSEIQLANVIASRGPNSLKFNMKWTPDLFDKSIIQGGGDPGWTAVGSDPVILEYLTLLAWNPEAVSRYCHYRITLEYICAFKQVNKTLLNTNQ